MTASSYRFVKVSPGGNTTILLLDPPEMTARERAELAARLMDPLHLGAEQVGYLSCGSEPHLEMMGGEFCGNAARSAAYLLVRQGHPAFSVHADEATGTLGVSGVDAPLEVRVDTALGTAAVEMPLEGISDCLHSHAEGCAVVHLDGISHVLLDAAVHPFPEDPVAACAAYREALGLDGPAVGCVWYSAVEDDYAITPVVWVRETATTHVETACGSGTVALALLMARERGASQLRARQPSGSTITAMVLLDGQGAPSLAWIDGPVRIVAEGGTHLEAPTGTRRRS
jgi:diaminopimelate epimerase